MFQTYINELIRGGEPDMSSNKLSQPFVVADYSSGMMDDLSVADSLLPKNAVRKAINVLFDRPRGAISQRYGTTVLGGGAVNAGNTILGLYNHRSATTSNHRLLAFANGGLYSYNGSSWGSESTLANATARVHFLTLLDQTVALNGVDPAKSTAGAGTWITTGGALDVGNWPVTHAASILNGRAFAIGNPDYPNRLYKSSIISSNAISWTSGNGTVDIKPNDGAGILRGIVGNGRVLILLKDRAMYRYDDNELQYIAPIGTPSHDSVVSDDNGINYFFGQGANGIGFYATTGGYPKKISRPITKWEDAIIASFYTDISGFCNGNKVYWSVGSLSIDGITYSNAWFVYSIADQIWDVRNYADRFRSFSQFINSNSNITIVGGDTDGFVQTIDSGTTDNGTAIASECEMAPITFTHRGEVKSVEDIVALASEFQGLTLSLSIDGGKFKQLGSIDAREKKFTPQTQLKGHVFQPKISAVNSQEPFIFEGLEFIDVSTEGYSF